MEIRIYRNCDNCKFNNKCKHSIFNNKCKNKYIVSGCCDYAMYHPDKDDKENK